MLRSRVSGPKMTNDDLSVSFEAEIINDRGDESAVKAFDSATTPLLAKSRSRTRTGSSLETGVELQSRLSFGLPFKRRSISFSISGVSAAPRLGALGICFVAFFNVSGGPWGSEGIVSSMGPLPGIVGVITIAVLWGLPLSLVTAELSSVYPDDGGYSIWVAEAFGEFWGFQESYWSWVSGVIDNAIYPVLAFKALERLIFYDSDSIDDLDSNLDSTTAFVVKAALMLVFSVPLFFTVREFGSGLAFIASFVLLPFLIFSIYAFFFSESRHFEFLLAKNNFKSRSDWISGIQDLAAVLYWNFSGLDCVSTCAGEVRNPRESYRTGLILALFLIILSYLVPLSASVVTASPGAWQSWDEGSFVDIVEDRMGVAMGIWIVIASFIGNAGMHAAEMFEDSWQLCGMAESGLAPRIFAARHPKFNTPYIALLFSMAIICALISMDFMEIVVISNFFSITSAMLELFAFLSLRLQEKPENEQERMMIGVSTYRLPVEGKTKLILLLMVPFVLGSFVMLSSFFDSWFSVLLDTLALALGLVLYHFMKKNGAINYEYEQKI